MRRQLSFEPHPFIRPPSRSRVYLCPFRELQGLKSQSTYKTNPNVISQKITHVMAPPLPLRIYIPPPPPQWWTLRIYVPIYTTFPNMGLILDSSVNSTGYSGPKPGSSVANPCSSVFVRDSSGYSGAHPGVVQELSGARPWPSFHGRVTDYPVESRRTPRRVLDESRTSPGWLIRESIRGESRLY